MIKLLRKEGREKGARGREKVRERRRKSEEERTWHEVLISYT